jgi:mannose-6-phosphate isomerase-like protein (cupin superfamily)
MSDVTAIRISETEGAFGGALRRIRAALGVQSFGIQVVELPPDSGDLYPAHSHDEQEEVFLVLAGSGEIVAGDETIPLDGDTIVRVGPRIPRQLRSGPEGLRALALGGTPGAAYDPSPWTEFGGPEPQPSLN